MDVPQLSGRLVRLEPLGAHHVDGLGAAADEDRSTFGYTAVPTGDGMAGAVAGLVAARAAGTTVPFAQVRVADGRPVGITRFLELRRREGTPVPYAVEVGGTWLAASAQRSGLNVEAKLLLLTHAFGVWGVGRVDIKTDARNARARTAIEGLGARFEGVLRNWQPSAVAGEEDRLRDSAMYSVTGDEWPDVRRSLEARLRVVQPASTSSRRS